ncbi:STE/STE11 protein kinase [Schizosaccharomyces japonicus yFS275]|uniref:STE/STE11 protein kinase n=1 Tax=Schizosaccharomyces japonicus (strain yFS275 / FY16936) TaxID=402676 RepID=B6K7Q9_SCHJY|nr:STE/STE11 protein kinase [Schizosaccharomyces japonicus yFS275]EEB09563.2 STE/STE11 protein kinase [Schizosaccharomyces japonicus yFS275]
MKRGLSGHSAIPTEDAPCNDISPPLALSDESEDSLFAASVARSDDCDRHPLDCSVPAVSSMTTPALTNTDLISGRPESVYAAADDLCTNVSETDGFLSPNGYDTTKVSKTVDIFDVVSHSADVKSSSGNTSSAFSSPLLDSQSLLSGGSSDELFYYKDAVQAKRSGQQRQQQNGCCGCCPPLRSANAAAPPSVAGLNDHLNRPSRRCSIPQFPKDFRTPYSMGPLGGVPRRSSMEALEPTGHSPRTTNAVVVEDSPVFSHSPEPHNTRFCFTTRRNSEDLFWRSSHASSSNVVLTPTLMGRLQQRACDDRGKQFHPSALKSYQHRQCRRKGSGSAVGCPSSRRSSTDESMSWQLNGDTGSDSDNDDSQLLDFTGSLSMLPISQLSNLALADPQNHERLEWHQMFTAVITGDIMRSEKIRLYKSAAANAESGFDYKHQLWLEIRCWLSRQSVESYQAQLEFTRSSLAGVLTKVLNFRCVPDHVASCCVDAVDQVLDELRLFEDCYPSRAQIAKEYPVYASDTFQNKVDVLTAYSVCVRWVRTQISILRKWIGNNDLNVIRRSSADSSTSSCLLSNSSFVERISRQSGLKRTFELKIMRDLYTMLDKVGLTVLGNSAALSSYGLSLCIDEYLSLISFPMQLTEHALRLRLSYVQKIRGTNVYYIDSMLEDFRSTISISVQALKRYCKLVDPLVKLEIPAQSTDSLQNCLVPALHMYFRLLHWKLRSGSVMVFLKEPEILRDEWEFLNSVCPYIQHGSKIMAEKFTGLASELMANVIPQYQKQLEDLPEDDDILIPWFRNVLDNVRVRFRKLMSFTRLLKRHFENACDFYVKESCTDRFLDLLVDSGHVLAYTATIEQDGAYYIVPGAFADKQKLLRSVFTSCLVGDYSADADSVPYVIVIAPKTSVVWRGRTVNVDLPDIAVHVPVNCVRLLTNVSGDRLRALKDHLEQLSNDTICLVNPSRASSQIINHELTKIKRMAVKLSVSLMDSVQILRVRCRNLDCQNLIHYTFSYAIDFSQRLLRLSILDNNWLKMVKKKMLELAISWVSFVYEDCSPADRNTFRWAVAALDFVMVVTRGSNILLLDEKSFEVLRSSVGKCMSLLLYHMDIFGAKSKLAARLEQEQKQLNKSLNAEECERFTDAELLAFVNEEMLMRINEVEERRRNYLRASQFVGRVLDDTIQENQHLKQLASSSSNITMRWQQGRIIGSGTFGTVYQGVNLDTGDLMAVKVISLYDLQSSPSVVSRIKDEAMVLGMLDHPNIVSFYGIEVHRDKVNIFMELCQGSSLAELLRYGRIQDEVVIQVYIIQLLEALTYMHARGVVHGDIKPENILFDGNGLIKFSDFGSSTITVPGDAPPSVKTNLARCLAETSANSRLPSDMLRGTPTYMAPELILGQRSDIIGAEDIWSLGCVIVEMATGASPWPKLDNQWALMYHIACLRTPSIPPDEQLSAAGQAFVRRCFESEPPKRATAAALLDDAWIEEIRIVACGEPGDDPAELLNQEALEETIPVGV